MTLAIRFDLCLHNDVSQFFGSSVYLEAFFIVGIRT